VFLCFLLLFQRAVSTCFGWAFVVLLGGWTRYLGLQQHHGFDMHGDMMEVSLIPFCYVTSYL